MTISTLGRRPGAGSRIAVVGSGISGASAAWALSGSGARVTLFEADARPGGHTATVTVDYDGTPVPVDTGFIVYNELTYPELTALFAHLGVATHGSSMGFSLSLDGGRLEWSGQSLASIFAQRRNLLSPRFLWMLREILRFNRLCVGDRDTGFVGAATIGEYLAKRGFSDGLRDDYLIPMASAIWSTPRAQMLDYPASAFISFFENHRLIDMERPLWRTVTGGAKRYLDRLLAPLGDGLRLASPVRRLARDAAGVTLWSEAGGAERFDAVVLACHSDQALALLGEEAHPVERAVLAAVPYRPNRVVLHRDPRLMPRRRGAWAAWNYLRSSAAPDAVSVTYWMNRLQGIDERLPLFVSLNPAIEPRAPLVFGEWTFDHPQYDSRTLSAQARLDDIQGLRNTWYAGAWTGYGFHEDGLRSGLAAAEALGARIPWRAGRVAPVPAAPALAAE
ncbi:FAD-dependent oxidoreductase [Aquibium sp. A9E412]|uniref:NAD(P)/FAD-dependent oxidoreductase n=1 Tax=Aquibium sp. A9E412 TaxID=2976767 RepID=UPI0025B1B343|nr:FAD-dependent oxidoreductase [Aquibium sp. A9E412]MDN2565995.1 FAD-dependent oxidoreductase [Aquibium sp. A9E412]